MARTGRPRWASLEGTFKTPRCPHRQHRCRPGNYSLKPDRDSETSQCTTRPTRMRPNYPGCHRAGSVESGVAYVSRACRTSLPPSRPASRSPPRPFASDFPPVGSTPHSVGMANSNKRKGDRAEREAVAAVCRLAPDLVVARPQRLLGAGRREDTGDLWVLPGVTVQVKHRADPAHAIRLAADGAAVQARRAGAAFAVGLVPVPRARVGAVRWVACGASWPGPPPEGLAVFHSVTAALQHVRRDDAAPQRELTGWRRCSGRPPSRCFWVRWRRGCSAYRGAVRGQPAAGGRTPPTGSRRRRPAHGDHRSADEGREPHASPASTGVPVSREFVHLHVHTEHSTRDGLSSPARICQRGRGRRRSGGRGHRPRHARRGVAVRRCGP